MVFRDRVHKCVIQPDELRKGVRVVSLRFSKSGALLLAQPCETCHRLLRACAHVREIAWSESDGSLVSRRT